MTTHNNKDTLVHTYTHTYPIHAPTLHYSAYTHTHLHTHTHTHLHTNTPTHTGTSSHILFRVVVWKLEEAFATDCAGPDDGSSFSPRSLCLS